MWENATDEVIDAAVLSEELREIVRENRRKHVVTSLETGSLLGNHLGHQSICFLN
jgi:hypothetical protein